MTLICIDAGTTNSRVWLTRGQEVLAHAQAPVGVRDTARDGSPARLHAGLRDLIADVRKRAAELAAPDPKCIVAAGMITSRLGLAEVPHVIAPAGLSELSSRVQMRHFPDLSELPVLLVPGVRSGPSDEVLGSATERDVMRGEETLCFGLLQLGIARAPCAVMNLGSHWKLIQMDDDGRIASSVTSLTGELIHATQTQTILASAVPPSRAAAIDREWCASGMKEQRQSGLPRALFCVRLLELEQRSTPEQRLSFLVGAFVASDADALRRRGAFDRSGEVLIAGGGPIASVWQSVLSEWSIPALPLTEGNVQESLLSGLRAIVEARRDTF